MLARQALHQLSDTPSPPCLLAGNLQRNLPVGGRFVGATNVLLQEIYTFAVPSVNVFGEVSTLCC